MFGHKQVGELVAHWKDYVFKKFKKDICGAEKEWRLVKEYIISNNLVNPKAKALEFRKPIICKADLFPSMHYILRLSLALCPSSSDGERLFHLLNRINRQDQ